MHLWLTYRYRGQAPSHIRLTQAYLFCVLIARRNAINHFTSSCGSIGFASFMVQSLESQTPQP